MTRPDSLIDRCRYYFGFGTGDDELAEELQALKRARTTRRLFWLGGLAVFLVGFSQALSVAEFSLSELIRYFPEFRKALTEYFPVTSYFGVVQFVDFGQYVEFIRARKLLSLAAETLAMGVVGTIIGAPIALLFGVLGSERVVPFPFNFVFRGIMSIIRSIPALVWALIYIPLGGVSPFTATLAIGTDTIGTLGRLFTDELEEIEEGPIEAIQSTGAGKRQVVTFGMLSQVFLTFIAWALYTLEINVRSAVGLGIIGAGGIGYVLQLQRQLFNYTNMMAAILVIVMLVVGVEMVSQRTRSHLRGTTDNDSPSLLARITGLPGRITESLLR